MGRDLTREDWLKAARIALLHGGVEAVRVEKLARTLGVTKGSFYWHFSNREEILEALLLEWEGQRQILSSLKSKGYLRQGMVESYAEVGRRVKTSERGESPSDAAVLPGLPSTKKWLNV